MGPLPGVVYDLTLRYFAATKPCVCAFRHKQKPCACAGLARIKAVSVYTCAVPKLCLGCSIVFRLALGT